MLKQKTRKHASDQYEKQLSKTTGFNFGPSSLIEHDTDPETDYYESDLDGGVHTGLVDKKRLLTTSASESESQYEIEYEKRDKSHYFDFYGKCSDLENKSGDDEAAKAIPKWEDVKTLKNREGGIRKRSKKVKFWEDYKKKVVDGQHREGSSSDEEVKYGKDGKTKIGKTLKFKRKFAKLTGKKDWDFSSVHLNSLTGKNKKKRFRLRVPFTHRDDTIIAIICIIALAILAVTMYFVYFYPRYAHLQVARGYGSLGYSEAQYQAGIRYLHKHEQTVQNRTRAVEWFKLAHEGGHKKASFMLAHTHVTHEEVRPHTGLAGKKAKILEMFKNGTRAGIPEARHMYIKCVNGDHVCE